MTVAPRARPDAGSAPLPSTLSWPFAGGEVRDIGVGGRYVEHPIEPAGPDEVVARIDAVCVCSSDIKIIRMGARHPLFNARDLSASPVILGHEMALTVLDVGETWQDRFRPGQRLGLQPAMLVDGKRTTIGMDLPGGFSQHIRLDRRMLDAADPYVFPIPDRLSAAAGAMLEPYSCVEAAYRPNSRTSLKHGGSLLIVGRPGGEDATLSLDTQVGHAVLLDAPDALRRWAETHAGTVVIATTLHEAIENQRFDDIILAGAAPETERQRLFATLADGGLLAFVAPGPGRSPTAVDVARIHYHALSVVGTAGLVADDAFAPARNRFDLRPGGTTLILGAGGAMGRIHAHRALDLENGPAVVIATSRKGRRCDALERDFGGLARLRGKQLVVVEDEALEARLATLAPDGCDDVVVVAPDVAAVERGSRLMRPDGMLVMFSGMPFGQPCMLPLGWAARHGARFTGSTGSKVEDQLTVLRRVTDQGLDLSVNLEAVAGFGALPAALEAVMEGAVCGKVAIYPALVDLPFTRLQDLRREGNRRGWSVTDEAGLASR